MTPKVFWALPESLRWHTMAGIEFMGWRTCFFRKELRRNAESLKRALNMKQRGALERTQP